mgnify:CR=1 FL=1
MGGENLVGWHVNRNFNQSADFFSVGRFRERFYQPAIIQKVMQMADEQEAVRAYRADMALLEKMNAEAAPTPAKPSVTAMAAGALAKVAPSRPQVSEALPPVIELQSDRTLETGEAQVPVRYVLRSPADAPVKDVKFRVNGKLERKLAPGHAGEPRVHMTEAQFRWESNEDAMATEKLAEGIRAFVADAIKLDKLLQAA